VSHWSRIFHFLSPNSTMKSFFYYYGLLSFYCSPLFKKGIWNHERHKPQKRKFEVSFWSFTWFIWVYFYRIVWNGEMIVKRLRIMSDVGFHSQTFLKLEMLPGNFQFCKNTKNYSIFYYIKQDMITLSNDGVNFAS